MPRNSFPLVCIKKQPAELQNRAEKTKKLRQDVTGLRLDRLRTVEFAARMENDFRFQVTVDDVDVQLGVDTTRILALSLGDRSEKDKALFREFLKQAGYIFKNKNAASGTFVWERNTDTLVFFADPAVFNRESEKVKILTSLFHQNPEYALIGRALHRGGNLGYIRHCFLKFARDRSWQEGTLKVPDASVFSLGIIDRITSELGLELFYDQAEYLLDSRSRCFLLKLKGQEQIKAVAPFLEQDGYRRFPAFPGEESLFDQVRYSKPGMHITAFLNELLFEKEVADSKWLSRLFQERPDYIFLANFFSKVMGSVHMRQAFLKLGKSSEFYELSFGIGWKSFPLPDSEKIKARFLRDVRRAEREA